MLDQLLSPSRIQLGANISSKKKALQILSQLFANNDSSLDKNIIFDALTSREKLGSTAMDSGIAIPHCRIPQCKQAQAVILTLQQGVDYDSRDGLDVDILWALIVPEQSTDEHLAILAKLAEILSDPHNCEHIRRATDVNTLCNSICFLDNTQDPSTRAEQTANTRL